MAGHERFLRGDIQIAECLAHHGSGELHDLIPHHRPEFFSPGRREMQTDR